MLVSFAGNIYHRLTNPASDHRHTTLGSRLIRWRQLVRPNRGHRVDSRLRLFCKWVIVVDHFSETGGSIQIIFSSVFSALSHRTLLFTHSYEYITSSFVFCTESIAAMRAVRDIFILQQRLSLALLAVSHVEREAITIRWIWLQQFHLLFDSTPGASMTRMTKYESFWPRPRLTMIVAWDVVLSQSGRSESNVVCSQDANPFLAEILTNSQS